MIKNTKDLEEKLNPISKLRIYQVARKIVFAKMDNQQITPERADEILSYVKDNVAEIDTPQDANKFYRAISKKFDELTGVAKLFKKEFDEKMEHLLIKIVENFVNKGEIEIAAKIMMEIEDIYMGKSDIDSFIKNRPDDFKTVLDSMLKMS